MMLVDCVLFFFKFKIHPTFSVIDFLIRVQTITVPKWCFVQYGHGIYFNHFQRFLRLTITY